MISTKPLVLAVILCGIATPVAAQNLTLTLQNPYVSVEPGGHADIPLVITNTGATTSAEEHVVMPIHRDTYTYEQLSDGCGPIGPDRSVQFSIDPIPAGESRICTVRVNRAANEFDNISNNWYIAESGSWLLFEMGTFTDLAVALTAVNAQYASDGTLHAIYRLDVSNISTVGADDAFIEFGPICVPAPVTVDMDLPGGCVRDEIGCPYEGTDAPAARLSIAAGESTSCLVRVTAPPGVDMHLDGGLTGGIQNPANGGWISDGNPANNGFSLDVAAGVPPRPSAPALSWWSMLLLAAALAGVAFGARRRLRR